ncbi:hypothetical protein KJ951_04860 [Patescibacteria group bacterium]|nr:hypothetical protein [Patescibacteria group bacterium]MBU1703707.1 hypothetical protein [Patescibacteria group bacterium]MBU1954326.1 hypothetical protein [Patescibacteria group bacterium]
MSILTIIPSPDEQPPPKYPSKERVEVDPRKPLRIEMAEMENRLMALYTADGSGYLGLLILNRCGNKCPDNNDECVCDRAYTFVFPNFYEVMLPIPTLGESFLVFKPGEKIFDEYFVDQSGNRLDVSQQHTALCVDWDGSVTVSDFSEGPGASIVFHDNSLVAEQSNVDESGSKRFDQSVLGSDASFDGLINGGRPVSAFTARELREPKAIEPKYKRLNEDSVTVNYALGNLVVADGLGGGFHGEKASSLAARWIAHSSKPLKQAIFDAHNALRVFNYAVTYFQRSDTVFVAAKLKGDNVDLAYTGDCGWIIVRNGRIVNRSEPDTLFFAEMKIRRLSKREAFLNKDLMDSRHIVGSSLATLFIGEGADPVNIIEDVPLLKGDILILFSDGACNLSEDEIELSVVNASPRDVIERLKCYIVHKNYTDFYFDEFDDGGDSIMVPSARDNVSIVVYKHE